MQNKKMKVVNLPLGFGCDKGNAYQLNIEMYEVDKQVERERLPSKRSHCDFIYELVIDVMCITTNSNKHSSSEMDKDDLLAPSINASGHRSMEISSSRPHNNNVNYDESEDDFFCESGIADVLKKYKLDSITN